MTHLVNGRLSQAHVRRRLPARVGVGVRYVSDMGAAAPVLHPLEEDILGARAVTGRRVLFALGRAAARDALLELGFDAVGIGRGEGGEPLWPEDVVGSITHSQEVAVAVVGRRTDYAGLGIDVEEPARGPTPRAARLVCRPNEMAWVDPESGTQRLTMLFSAKEAIFKAAYPIQLVWLGFADAELTWIEERGGFDAEILKSVGDGFPVGLHLQVNCTLGADWVLSTAFVTADVRRSA